VASLNNLGSYNFRTCAVMKDCRSMTKGGNFARSIFAIYMNADPGKGYYIILSNNRQKGYFLSLVGVGYFGDLKYPNFRDFKVVYPNLSYEIHAQN
jgi:hypothetical protein